MPFEIIFAPEAVTDLRELTAHDRSAVLHSVERHLRHRPGQRSRSRIKRLKGVRKPQYRLRVNELRIFYDIRGDEVQILAIIAKSKANRWLEQFGDSV